MEVEVKLRLLSQTAHANLTAILTPYHIQTHLQQNLFFDTPSSLLSSSFAALRIRFYNLDTIAVLSLKCNPQITSGISRIEEHEEPLDPALARLCVAEPWRLLGIESEIMKRVVREFGLGGGDEGLVCIGGFRNVRGVYEWEGLRLEVDETDYGFGTCFEVECESLEPEIAKGRIEGLLKENGIEYVYSEVSKFAVFRAGKLPDC